MRNSRAHTEAGSVHQKQSGQSLSNLVHISKDQSVQTIRGLLDLVRRNQEPLIERLRNLSRGMVAGFAEDLALLSETLLKTHWADDGNQSIRKCRELLPTLCHPVDMLSPNEKASLLREQRLTKQHVSFMPLLKKVTEMNRLSEQLKNVYPTISGELIAVVRNYEQFIITLCSTTIKFRAHMLESTAVISGDGIGLLSVSADLGLSLLCRNRLGQVYKTNQYGNHPVTQYEGVFYKPNPTPSETLGGLFICPGNEFRAVTMLQLIAGEFNVAAPTSFIKVQNVQKFDSENKPDGFLSGTIQTGLAIDGISGLELLLICSQSKLVSQNLEPHEQLNIYTSYVHLESKLEKLFESNNNLRAWYHKDLPRKIVAEKEEIHLEFLPFIISTIRLFPELENNRNCRDFDSLMNGNPIDQSNVIDRWLGSTPLKVIIQFLALLPDFIPLSKLFTLEDTIKFVNLMRHLPRMFPSFLAEEICNDLPDYLCRIDADHFSATAVAHMILKPNDGKPDNFIAELELNIEKSKVVCIRFIGIDNNGFMPFALTSHSVNVGPAQHYNNLECFLFLLDAMETKISLKFREHLLSRTALEWTLDYAKIVYEYCERIQQLKDQKTLSETDLEFQGQPILDIPPKFYLVEFSRFYEEWKVILDFLQNTDALPSLNSIFQILHPVVFEIYKSCRQKRRDINLAYGEVHRSGNVELVLNDLDETIKVQLFRTLSESSMSSAEIKEGPSSTCAEAILHFFRKIHDDGLSEIEYRSFLNRVGIHFSRLTFLTSQDMAWKANRLLQSARYALPGMAEILLFHGAKIDIADEAGRTLLHLLFEKAHLHHRHQVLETLDCYLASEMIDLNRADQHGFFPILLAVKSLDDDLAVDVLERFVQKDVWLDQIDFESGETALDVAMRKRKIKSVCALIRLGAGGRFITDPASEFFAEYHDPDLIEYYNALRQRSSEFEYFESLRSLCAVEAVESHQIRVFRCNKDGQVNEMPFSLEFQEKLFNMPSSKNDHLGESCGLIISNSQGNIVAIQNPRSFGREIVPATLRKKLFGHSTSHAELFKSVTVAGESYPLLLSSMCSGDDLLSLLRRESEGDRRAEALLQVLDPQTTWELILVSMLVLPALTDSRKYVLRSKTIQGQYVSQIDYASHNHTKMDSAVVIHQNEQHYDICILFCLEIMKSTIDSKVIEKFLRINAKDYLADCLKELMLSQKSVDMLFPQGSIEMLQGLMVSTHRGMTLDIYDRMILMCEAFRNNPYITGAQLIRIVFPKLNDDYETILMSEKSVLARFDKLAKPIVIHLNEITPQKALTEFEALMKKVEELNSCRVSLGAGEIDAFARLMPADREEVLKYFDFKEVSVPYQDKIILNLMKTEAEWRELRLVNCKVLSEDKLKRILRNSCKSLELLDLRHSPFTVGDDYFKFLENYQELRELNHTASEMITFIDVNLPNLQVLILSRSSQLVKLTNQVIQVGPRNRKENRLAMPKLKIIKAAECISLSSVETDSRVIAEIDVHQSSKLKAVFLSKNVVNLPIRRADFAGCESLSNISVCFYPLLLRQVERSATFSDEQSIKLASTSISLLVRAKVPLVPETLRQFGISSWKRIRIPGSDLSDANLENLDLEGADLRGVNCTNAKLKGVNWSSANLKGLMLSKTNRRSVESITPRSSKLQEDADQFEGLRLDNCKGLSFENLFLLKRHGAQGVPYAEFMPPLSHVVSSNNITIEDIDCLKRYCESQNSESQDRLISVLKFEIENRFQQYLWTIVLRSKESPRYSIDASRAISLLNWARVKMNAFALAVFGIEDLKNIKISGADLTYADLSDVDMTGADCGGVQIWGANLNGVNWTKANLDKACLIKPAGRTFAERDLVQCDGLILDQCKISEENRIELHKRGNIIVPPQRPIRKGSMSYSSQEAQQESNSSLGQFSPTQSPTRSPAQSPRRALPQLMTSPTRARRVVSIDELTLPQVESPRSSSLSSFETGEALQTTNHPLKSLLPDNQVVIEVNERHIIEQELEELQQWMRVGARAQFIDFQRALEPEKLEKRLSRNEGYLDTVNAEILKLKKILIIRADNFETQSRLIQLEQQYQQLIQLQEVLARKLLKQRRHTVMFEKYGNKSNVFGFYRAFNIKLEELFLGCKALSSNLYDLSAQSNNSKNTLGKVGLAINLLGNIVKVIPAFGNSAKAIMTSAGNIMIHVDQQRMMNLIKAFSMFGTIKEMQNIAELLARKLAVRYEDQIESLRTLEEEISALEMDKCVGSLTNKLCANFKSIADKAREVCLKDAVVAPVQLLAEYCVLQIFEAIKDNELDPSLPLETQLFELLTCPSLNKRMLVNLVDKVSRKFSIDTLVTKNGREWQMGDIFLMTGIKTPDGQRYSDSYLKPGVFGFCLGSEKEVRSRVLNLLITPSGSASPKLLTPASSGITNQPKRHTIQNSVPLVLEDKSGALPETVENKLEKSLGTPKFTLRRPVKIVNSAAKMPALQASRDSICEETTRSARASSNFFTSDNGDKKSNNNGSIQKETGRELLGRNSAGVTSVSRPHRELPPDPASRQARSVQTSPRTSADLQATSPELPPRLSQSRRELLMAKAPKVSASASDEGSKSETEDFAGNNVNAVSPRQSLLQLSESLVMQEVPVIQSEHQADAHRREYVKSVIARAKLIAANKMATSDSASVATMNKELDEEDELGPSLRK